MNKQHVRELVDWLRCASPDHVIEKTIQYLRAGEPEDHLWAAAALTAARYINNQAHNNLGFVSHAMIGTEDARRLAGTQDTRTRHLLLIQSIGQVVADLHDPCMGPFELFPARGLREHTVEENINMLRVDARVGEFSRCDHRFVTLEQDLSRDQLVNLLLEIGLEGITTDEHTVISPVLCLGMIDLVGWDDGFEMLRGTLRYNASFSRNFAPHERALALQEQYGLMNGATGAGFDLDAVEHLRQALHAAPAADRPVCAARFMADGHAPETVVAAISMVGCDMYLMAVPVPHEDFDAISREVAPVHMGTGMSALRAALKYLDPATTALAVIRGASLLERGPSVLNEDFEFVPFEPAPAYPYTDDVAALSGQSADALLTMLHSCLEAHDYRTATATVKVYGLSDADPQPLIALLTQVACTDNMTLMHSLKHLNSMVNEFGRSQHPDRWNYLIAAARFMAWYTGVKTDVYDRAIEALEPVAT